MLQIYSSFRKWNLFEKIFKPQGCENFSSVWPLFSQVCPNCPNFFPISFDEVLILNILSYWKFYAEFKSFYRFQLSFFDQKIFKILSALQGKLYCNIKNPKKAHQPEMELGENLKEHFSKTTFYGLHAGNSQNSIWKPHSNFAFPEPYNIYLVWIHRYLKKLKKNILCW